MESPNEAKKTLCEELLDIGMVMVVVDARNNDVEVPIHLLGDPKLRLNLSFKFDAPLAIEDWGIRATLSFNKSPFECVLPWEAVYVVFSHVRNEPYVFPDDVPEEVLEEIGIDFTENAAPLPQKPALRVITGERENSPEPELAINLPAVPTAQRPKIDIAPVTIGNGPTDEGPDDPPRSPRPRRHLRVVK